MLKNEQFLIEQAPKYLTVPSPILLCTYIYFLCAYVVELVRVSELTFSEQWHVGCLVAQDLLAS